MNSSARKNWGTLPIVAFLVVFALGLGTAIAFFGPEAAGAIPAAAAGAAVLTRPVVGLLAVVFPIPFEDVFLLSGTVTITRLMAACVAGLWLAHKVLRGDSWREIVFSPVVILGASFIGFATLSLTWAEYPGEVSSGISRLVMLLALSLMTIDLLSKWEHVDWFFRVLVVGGTIAAVLVVMQYFETGVNRAGDQIGGGVNATATVLVMLLPFGFYLLRANTGLLWRLLALSYVASSLVAITVTFSRMSFLLLPLVLLAEGWETFFRSGRRLASTVALVVAAFIAFQFIPTEKVRERIETIGPYIESTLTGGTAASPEMSGRGFHLYVAWRIFQDHPILGVGYGNYGRHFLDYQLEIPGRDHFYRSARSPHSSFAGVLADLGLVGLTIWLTMLGTVLFRLVKAWKWTSVDRSSREFLISRAVLLSFGLTFAYGFYNEMQYEKLFWLVLGVAVVVHRLARSDRLEPPESGTEARRRRLEDGGVPAGRVEVIG